ncbi:MAG: tail fiber domain-containing protein, partial [Kiritimatiellia bacterium]|nr:tail fiber domain-containing protein [Kiritimatiellia bacterium]
TVFSGLFNRTLMITTISTEIARISGNYESNAGGGRGGLLFKTKNSDESLATKMTIMGNGNVGIGTTPSPLIKLDVNGPALIRGVLGISGGDYRIQTLDGSQLLALRSPGNDTVLVPAYYGFRVTDYVNSKNHLISDFYGNLHLPYGILFEGSDSRTKLDQEPLDYGLAEVLKLEPKRYVRIGSVAEAKTGKQESRGEAGESEIGLIAQEVYEVVPEAVATVEDHGKEIWLLSYSSLVPVLVKAVQEQQKQIEELKDRITRLEKKNKR